jgi:metabolite-proton symporter
MTAQPTPARRSIARVALTTSAGAAIEWYDFFIYGTAAALVFPRLFFAADLPPFVAQIAAFSTFAVGFIARPIGGVLFGHFGDLFGRKRALSVALVVMGVATTCVGLLPTYATAGVLAPLLLVALRFVQGLAVGGQWGGAALLAIESAPHHRQGFYGSFVQIGVPIGVVLANFVFLIVGLVLPHDAFLAWGWRIPFLLSVALVGVGFYVHLRLEEPEAFEEAVAEAGVTRSPLAEVLKHHWGNVLLAGGAFIANNTCFYVAIVYAVAYGSTTVGVSEAVMLSAVMVGSIVMIPVLIACGALSDRYGRRGIFMWGAVLSGLWGFAMFPLIQTGSPVAITAAIGVELVLISLMYGPQAALFAELFPVKVRYSGASLGYQIGSVFGGGFAPIVATALFARYQSAQSIATYLFAMCMISLVSVAILARKAARETVKEATR